MHRNSIIFAAAIVSLAIASCGSEGEQQATNTPQPSNPPAQTQQPQAQKFNNPVVPAKESSLVAQASPSLIQPTNPTERINFVSKGRSDPFEQLVKQYPQGLSDPSTKLKPVPLLPPLPAVVTVARTPQKRSAVISAKINSPNTAKLNASNTKTNRNPSLISVLPRVLPQVIPDQKLKAALPPSPQPDLAKAVFVSGVVLLGNQPQAIIKVPNEPTSRYVQPGQRLANGVLIKRIEMNEGLEPIVILEQYGIEVAKMVGEAPAGSPAAATTTAVVPNTVLETSPTQNPLAIGSS
ncbi:hypothetical protein ACF3DV_07275 [Chlorogloeopsis fritschii PCC 9212]|uniref:Pilus assembly protein PilP n=1 Tax=Chlorogloeopsis fritschii PCC 6912 TaxID=211165 RepID=A0A433MWY9_CHLFR|nr:hypothetical protein [Chlorogloeopsis fritschii]MBF2007626.1 hypothetical protein [Chlorogloeopsis fritschii C42_A2020_084]RUR72579.1 hypothetical protein PCC6912_62230 [Chlorogloeopsis fritschii PCC 6912]